MNFDPEDVSIFTAVLESDGHEVVRSVVLMADYDRLLSLYQSLAASYRALQPQMTLAERYGTITVK